MGPVQGVRRSGGASLWRGDVTGLTLPQRTWEIWSFVFSFVWKRVFLNAKFSYWGKWSEEARKVRLAKQATWLREGLLRLGPTFIKIGQQFSTRVDVLSPELIRELEKLQDRVPPFSSDAAVRIIEEQLGGPLDSHYSEFERQPIAAASLGQVHRAVWNGLRVIVKVQRPGLRELFEIDLKNLRVIAQWLQKLDPKTDGAARDWVAIYDECRTVLYQEIDYTNEGTNAMLFRNNFAATPWVKVPEVYWEKSAQRVLTMEYCPGLKINRVEEIERLGLNRSLLARYSVEAYLQQILRYGFFHADPHPGNIAVDAGYPGGRLIFYDFGMMGTLRPGVRTGLLNLFYSVYEKDSTKCLEALVTMGVLVPTGDLTAVRRTAQFFLDSFEKRLVGQSEQRAAVGDEAYSAEFKPQRTKDEKSSRRRQILGSIGEDLLSVSKDQPFRFPATFTFVVRAFSVLDGIGKGLDAKFDISEIARPYARELLLEAQTVALPPQLVARQRDLARRAEAQARALVNLFKGPDRIENVESLLARIESGAFKPRVRALEVERAVERLRVQSAITQRAVLACAALNVGTALTLAASAPMWASVAFSAAGLAGLGALGAALTLRKLDRKEAALSGA